MSKIILERAEKIAAAVIEKLSPYCESERIVAAGSVRRKRPWVNDIDFVLIPLCQVPASFLCQGAEPDIILDGAGPDEEESRPGLRGGEVEVQLDLAPHGGRRMR